MIDISVVIVTWNSANEIARCLGSIFNNSNTDNLKIEVIVIDNNSQDETINILKNINHPGVHICENSTNTGYTQGTNKGINLSQGKYILLLNPDTELSENCIKVLYDYLVHNPGHAASVPLLLNEDGSTQYSIRNFPTYWSMYCEFSLLAYIFPKSWLFGRWKMKYFEYSKDCDVNQPMAAALMIRKDVLDKLGNMDE
jgi:hypothetical protein